MAVSKVEGVETVDVSLEKSSAVITLRAGNKVTLPQLRRVIRSSGYPTRDARIDARGRITERGGRPVLDLLNGSTLELVEKPKDAPASEAEITGVSRALDKANERLTVVTIKK